IVVRFDSPVSGYVRERRWHASQKIISLEGGAIEIRLQTGVTPDLVQWVLGFGAAARALSPPELCQEVRQAASAVLEKYALEPAKAKKKAA
ncbi:WYL domain-containing protein, partial [Bdellovibrionota bacterium FG-2]